MFSINKRLVIMNRWNARQRAFAIKVFYLNSCSYNSAAYFHAHFGINRNRSVLLAHAIQLKIKVEENEIFELKRILNELEKQLEEAPVGRVVVIALHSDYHTEPLGKFNMMIFIIIRTKFRWFKLSMKIIMSVEDVFVNNF
jgi:hypothetical protein